MINNIKIQNYCLVYKFIVMLFQSLLENGEDRSKM